MSNFDVSIEYVLTNEGSFIDNPNDKGGPTNYGITQRTLSLYRKAICRWDDVKNLSVLEARAIYRELFWIPMRLDLIGDINVATAILDVAVNKGQQSAVYCSQRAAGISVDGVMGPHSRDAINGMTRFQFLSKFIPCVQNEYIDLVLNNPSQIEFLRGWINRSQRLLILFQG